MPDVDYFQQMALNPTQMKSNKVLVRPAPSAFTASTVSAGSKLSMSMDELDVGAASWGDVDVTIEAAGRKKGVGESRAAPKGAPSAHRVLFWDFRMRQGHSLDSHFLAFCLYLFDSHPLFVFFLDLSAQRPKSQSSRPAATRPALTWHLIFELRKQHGYIHVYIYPAALLFTDWPV